MKKIFDKRGAQILGWMTKEVIIVIIAFLVILGLYLIFARDLNLIDLIFNVF